MPDQDYPALVLEKGRDRAVRARHHWIFSGAARRIPDCEDGSIVAVRSAAGELLGHGVINRRCSILARMISFDAADPLASLEGSFRKAAELRRRLLGDATDAYRVVNAEADGIPGLIVDRYGDVCVVQIAVLGLEKLKEHVLSLIEELCAPRAVYERSDSPARAEEGLEPFEGWVAGHEVPEAVIHERGRRYVVQFARSQKTGFYLDQRANRDRVQSLAQGRRLLDAFSYTGGFAVAGLRGGARNVDLVDSSEAALETARRNVELNGFGSGAGGSGPGGAEAQGPGTRPEARFHAADAVDFLRDNPLRFDFVVLDPPAFAKKKQHVAAAARAYEGINRAVLAKLPPGSLLLTCSCSYHVDAALFQKIIFTAALKAGRNVSIVGRHVQAVDHPVNVYHPETDYLKSLLLYVG